MAATRQRNAAISNKAVKSNGHIIKQNSTNEDVKRETNSASPKTIAKTILTPSALTPFILIFGGCCSNVYVLESILSFSPASGPLFTFLQFLFTALYTLPSQLTTKRPLTSNPPSWTDYLPRLRTRDIPLRKWLVYTAMFLTSNMLNNLAFGYRISLPLHIILRSAGPVSSMLVGYLWAGRRYGLRKVFAVLMLFSGVVVAALADAASKGKVESSGTSATSGLSQQLPGFMLILTALIISACLGVYTDQIYELHGRSGQITNENLFYSHVLSLPYFATQYRSLHGQYVVMLANESKMTANTASSVSGTSSLPAFLQPLASYIPINHLVKTDIPLIPVFLLIANGFTQIMCISGVNQLATESTSLTVSVTLNIRKLVSLLLSIWLFGNELSTGVVVGAVLVFLGGGLYSVPSRSAKNHDKKDE